MMRPISLFVLAALPAFGAPEFELRSGWFAFDAPLALTNDVTLACEDTRKTFTPTVQLPAHSPAAIDARVIFGEADVGAARQLRALPATSETALTVASNDRGELAYFGWTANGWIELSGATPALNTPLHLRIETDTSIEPATIRFSADGQFLSAANDSTHITFASALPADSLFASVQATHDLKVESVTGERELTERVAAVVTGESVVGYFSSLAAARHHAAEVSGEVTLLRPTSVSDPRDLDGTFRIADSAVCDKQPVLTYVGDPTQLAGTHALISLPEGNLPTIPFAAPADPALLATLHLHGDAGFVYSLYPSTDTYHLTRQALQQDRGAFTAFLTTPERGRSFLRGLADGTCGSENALYVNGLGSLDLCAADAFTGEIYLEASHLLSRGGLARAVFDVLTEPAALELADEPNAADAPVTLTNNTVVLTGVTDDLLERLTLTLAPDTRRLAYLVRNGSALVAKVAEAPRLVASDSFSFSLTRGEGGLRLTATLANAIAGFSYGWTAADNPSGPFIAVGTPVTATRDGSLTLVLDEPPQTRRFYRFHVEASR